MGKNYKRLAGVGLVLTLMFAFLWFGGTGVYAEGSTEGSAEGSTEEVTPPKSQPVKTHTPQTYVVDYTKPTSERAYNKETEKIYGEWNNLPILFPGDKVEIIPDLPEASEAVSGTANGIAGVVFNNPQDAEDRYPIHVTKSNVYGESHNPDVHDAKYIQEFEVVGDYPVVVSGNGGGGYSSEQEEVDPVNHIFVTLGYHAEYIYFRYSYRYLYFIIVIACNNYNFVIYYISNQQD